MGHTILEFIFQLHHKTGETQENEIQLMKFNSIFSLSNSTVF